ncbi:MAG: uroporphyrinogen-III synthase [Bacteroidota bacterium]
MSATILSTKILSPAQKSLVLHAGLQLVHYNAICIDFLEVVWPAERFDAFIFTSQNGVKAFLAHQSKPSNKKSMAFCVGQKTKLLLESEGFQVIAVAENAAELGAIITEHYRATSFLLISGSRSREELPKLLAQNRVLFQSVVLYQTELCPQHFKRSFDGILFFSPSGVNSYCQNNSLSGTAFCIGNTTARALEAYTQNYIVAQKPTIENVLVQAIKHLRQYSNDTLSRNGSQWTSKTRSPETRGDQCN